MMDRWLRVRISKKQEDELRKFYRESQYETCASFVRHVFFNLGLNTFRVQMEEKKKLEKIRDFIFERKKA